MANQALVLPGPGVAGSISVPTPTPHNQDWTCGWWFYWDGTQDATAKNRMGTRYGNSAGVSSCWSTVVVRNGAANLLSVDVRDGKIPTTTLASLPWPPGSDRGSGTWRYLLLSNDFAGGKLNAYLDSALAYTLSYTPSALAANVEPVWFGSLPGETGPIKGSIDCAAFWSRQLTGAERTALIVNRSYADLAANAPSLLSGLVWCLDFDDAAALADRSGNGRDATVTGSVAYGAGVPAWAPTVTASPAVSRTGRTIMITMHDALGKPTRVSGFPTNDPTFSRNGTPISLAGAPGPLTSGPLFLYFLPPGTTIAPGEAVTMAAAPGWANTAAGLAGGGTLPVANPPGRAATPNYPVDLSAGTTMKAGGMLNYLAYWTGFNPFGDLLKEAGAMQYAGLVVPTLQDDYPDPAKWPVPAGSYASSLICTPSNFSTAAAPSVILSDKGGVPNYRAGTLTLAWSSRDGVSSPDNITVGINPGGFGSLAETTSPPYASQAGPTRHRTYTLTPPTNHYSVDLKAYYYGPNIAGVSLTHSASTQGEFNADAVRQLSSYDVLRAMFLVGTLESCVAGVEHLRPDGALSYSTDAPMKRTIYALRVEPVANVGGTPFWYKTYWHNANYTSVILRVAHDGSIPVYDRQYGKWGGSAVLRFNDGATALRAGSAPASDTSGGAAPPAGLAATPAAAGGTLAAGTYYYQVTATNAAGETLASAEVSATTTGGTGSVALTWSAVAGATGYRVYRSAAPGGQGTSPALAGQLFAGAGTSYTDTGVSSDMRRPASDGLFSVMKVEDSTHFLIEYTNGYFDPIVNNYGAAAPMQVVAQDLAAGALYQLIGINSLSQASWAGTGILRGAPFGACTRLAKACGADLWASVYLTATDACAAAIADSIFANVTPADVAAGWKVLAELTNEHWNGGLGFFYGYATGVKWGLQDGITLDQWHAKRARQVHQVFRARATAAGLDPAVVIGVYGVQAAANGGDAVGMVNWLNTHRDDGTAVPAGDPTAIKLGANDAWAIINLVTMPISSNPTYMDRMNALDDDQIQDLSVPNILNGYYPTMLNGLKSAVRSVYPGCQFALYEAGAAILYEDPDIPYVGYRPPARAAKATHAMVRHPHAADWKMAYFKLLQDQGFSVCVNEMAIGLETSHERKYTNPAYWDAADMIQAVGPGDGTVGMFGVGGHDNRADFEALDQIESPFLYATAVWNHARGGGGQVPPPPPPVDFAAIAYRHGRRRPLGRRLG